MFKYLKEKFKKIPRNIWILLAIVAVGIFLRTYNFHDWLQFSPDQARDALIVSDAINGTTPLPLLGPQAGNTRFSIGPLYYEAQYLSAKTFGNTPVVLAYPDLFFSILTIPLLYLFLKKYFSIEISLAMSALFSFSYFAIVNSRFASNPNSIPFFVLLFFYALLELMREQKNKQRLFLWYAVAGFAMGVGIQLHTILVFTMPSLLLCVFVWLWKEKLFQWKGFVFLLVAFLVINTGQILHEFQTSGINTVALLNSVLSRSNTNGNLFRNITVITSCQVEANINFVSSLENNKDCGKVFYFKDASKNLSIFKLLQENLNKILAILSGVIFTIGGYVLLWKFFKKESDRQKRNFIWLIFAYNIISLIVLIPVATEVELRYFNVINMIPFVLLGMWLMLVLENKNYGKISAILLVVAILSANIYVDANFAVSYARGQISNKKNSILGEIEPVAQYIINKSQSSKVLLIGGSKYTKRFYKPLYYLLKKNNIELVDGNNKKNIAIGVQVFRIDKNLGNKYVVGKNVGDFIVEDIYAVNKNIRIYLLKK
jgi:4-amino-4-deoxy-L-arabinose transferase-like glycosyltransferase